MAKKSIKSTLGTSKKDKKKLQDTLDMLYQMDQFKMVTMYVLRNQGWGKKRLKRFNAKWNEYFIDISMGLFSIEDIMGVIKSETGLTPAELMIQQPKGENNND